MVYGFGCTSRRHAGLWLCFVGFEAASSLLENQAAKACSLFDRLHRRSFVECVVKAPLSVLNADLSAMSLTVRVYWFPIVSSFSFFLKADKEFIFHQCPLFYNIFDRQTLFWEAFHNQTSGYGMKRVCLYGQPRFETVRQLV